MVYGLWSMCAAPEQSWLEWSTEANQGPFCKSVWNARAALRSQAKAEWRILLTILEPTECLNHFNKHRTGFGSGEPSSTMCQLPRLHCRGKLLNALLVLEKSKSCWPRIPCDNRSQCTARSVHWLHGECHLTVEENQPTSRRRAHAGLRLRLGGR